MLAVATLRFLLVYDHQATGRLFKHSQIIK